MFKFFKKKNKKNNGCSSFKIVAKCPKCGNNLVESEDYLSCTGVLSGECNFQIKNTINGEKIDLEIFADFQKKVTQIQHVYNTVNEKINKKAHVYDTVSEKTNKKAKEINIERSKQKQHLEKVMLKSLTKRDKFFVGARMLEGHCINCASIAFRNGNTVKCSNEDCNFTVSTIYSGINFSDKQMSQLIGRRISEEYTFTNKNGERFKGRVFLDFDDRIQMTSEYKFVDDISSLPEKYFEHIYAPDKKNELFVPLKTLLEK